MSTATARQKTLASYYAVDMFLLQRERDNDVAAKSAQQQPIKRRDGRLTGTEGRHTAPKPIGIQGRPACIQMIARPSRRQRTSKDNQI